MSFQEKTIECSDCGKPFIFTVEEQEHFKSRGYTNEPKRCPECRQARKEQQSSSGNSYNSRGRNSYSNYNSAPRQMYPAKCAECGKDTEVPFEPRSGKPVYCSDCYRKMKARS